MCLCAQDAKLPHKEGQLLGLAASYQHSVVLASLQRHLRGPLAAVLRRPLPPPLEAYEQARQALQTAAGDMRQRRRNPRYWLRPMAQPGGWRDLPALAPGLYEHIRHLGQTARNDT